jgi:hypothetical protein
MIALGGRDAGRGAEEGRLEHSASLARDRDVSKLAARLIRMQFLDGMDLMRPPYGNSSLHPR